MLAALVVFTMPGLSGLFLFYLVAVWAISIYAVVTGITLVILGFRLRSWWKDRDRTLGGAREMAR